MASYFYTQDGCRSGLIKSVLIPNAHVLVFLISIDGGILLQPWIQSQVEGAFSIWCELSEGSSDCKLDKASTISGTIDLTKWQQTWTGLLLNKSRPFCLILVLVSLCGMIGPGAFPSSELRIFLHQVDRVVGIEWQSGYIRFMCSDNELQACFGVEM